MPQTSTGIARGSLHGCTMRGKEFPLVKLHYSRASQSCCSWEPYSWGKETQYKFIL